MEKKPRKKEIGWKDRIDFPTLNLFNVDIKIDTGAKTSVIHCSYIEKIEGKKNRVKFIPLGKEFPGFTGEFFILPYHSEKTIKNSFGDEENRFVIRTKIILFGKKQAIDISLRDRSAMEFPVLIGRDSIRNKFLVNVSRTNLSYKRKLKKENQESNT